MEYSLTTITPQIAAQWLGKSKGNIRPMSEHMVKSLMKEIQLGEWRVTHQGIAFDQSGALIDGHHRLTAISRGLIPVKMWVARDVSGTGLEKIDSGARRPNHIRAGTSRIEAGALNYAVKLISEEGGTIATTGELKAMMDSKLGKSVAIVCENCGKKRITCSAPVVVAVALAHIEYGDKVLEQYQRLLKVDLFKMKPGIQRFFQVEYKLEKRTPSSLDRLGRAWMAFSNLDEIPMYVSRNMRMEAVKGVRRLIRIHGH